MRFAIIRKADQNTEKGCMPSNEMLLAMGRYNQELVDAGVMRAGEGLHPTRDAVRLKFPGGQAIITDGPFAETREQIAGFTIIEVATKAEALEWAKKWPRLDTDSGAELELRQVFEQDDFVAGEGIDLHSELSERLARQPVSACPYLYFPGSCRAAFELYADCLGGKIQAMMPHAEAPPGEVPADVPAHSIMHACLQVGKWTLMGSDCPPEYYETPQGFSVQITIGSVQHAESAFQRLAEGGQVKMPFAKTFWADRFGMLVDRFGIPWMINCNVQACTA